MPKRRTARAVRVVELAVRHLDGSPLAPKATQRLLGLVEKKEGSREERTPPLTLPDLPEPVPATVSGYVRRTLALWALLSTGAGGDPRCQAAARELVEGLWGPGGVHEGKEELEKLFSVPIVLLWVPERRKPRVPNASGTAWEEAYERCLAWFRGHLQRAQGKDATANWVLRRVPPVWLVVDRGTAGGNQEVGGVSLAEQVDRWLPPPDEQLEHRPRRTQPPPRSRGR